MHNYKELRIWQEAMEVAQAVYQITSAFPANEKFGLTSQINRAAISIPSNIAEGAGRSTNKEFSYFISVALGSAYELETQLLLASRIGLTKVSDIEKPLLDLERVQKMLYKFKQTLKPDK